MLVGVQSAHWLSLVVSPRSSALVFTKYSCCDALGIECVVLPCDILESSGVASFLVVVSGFLLMVLAANLLLETDTTDMV
jgi:hypothetical protein